MDFRMEYIANVKSHVSKLWDSIALCLVPVLPYYTGFIYGNVHIIYRK